MVEVLKKAKSPRAEFPLSDNTVPSHSAPFTDVSSTKYCSLTTAPSVDKDRSSSDASQQPATTQVPTTITNQSTTNASTVSVPLGESVLTTASVIDSASTASAANHKIPKLQRRNAVLNLWSHVDKPSIEKDLKPETRPHDQIHKLKQPSDVYAYNIDKL